MSDYIPEYIMRHIDRVAQAHLCRQAGVPFNHPTPPARKVASAVIVGDIFYSKWGYDQTNLDYYQVVKTTAKTVALRKIGKRMTKGKNEPTEWYMPTANTFIGPVMRKKLRTDYTGRPAVNISSYASAYKWDGKAQSQTGGAYGH
jgi:hypothetical protein